MRSGKINQLVSIFLILGFIICAPGFAEDVEDFIPGEDSGFFYTIQKGDTLWDLSQKFYNSEWDWPGLWEMNDDIKNPHWIYPGKKIRIFLKEKPPLKPKMVEVKKYPPKKTEPVKPSFSFSQMDQLSFLRKSQETSLGTIIKEKESNLLMSKNDTIYIEPSGKAPLIPGKTYHVFSATKIKEKINGKNFTGIKHIIKAKINILEHKVSYATAMITESYLPAEKGDMVMEYFKRESVLTVEDEPAPIDARIICSEDNRIMINDYIIAFINIGSDSVKPGEIYTVMRKNEIKYDASWPMKKQGSQVQLEDLESGKLIVLHTEDISSTVMILSSKYAIYPDDMVN